MAKYEVVLTSNQDTALKAEANKVNKTPQEVIDEQVNYYIKAMLTQNAKDAGIMKEGDFKGLTDEQGAELTAILLNAKGSYLNAISNEEVT